MKSIGTVDMIENYKIANVKTNTTCPAVIININVCNAPFGYDYCKNRCYKNVPLKDVIKDMRGDKSD